MKALLRAPRLGVNIDHVATLRQARGEAYPDVTKAAEICLQAGADQITIHLREDRRHIQDGDVLLVKNIVRKFSRPLNLELAPEAEMVKIALDACPDWICLVPEKREERTTEGGLDLKNKQVWQKVNASVESIKMGRPEIKVSLFLEADMEVLEAAAKMKIDAVEIHTGDYARDFILGKNLQHHFDSFNSAKKFLDSHHLGVHAGHGLTDKSLAPLVQENYFVEYNIGHWIISEAVFDGLHGVVANLKNICSKSIRK